MEQAPKNKMMKPDEQEQSAVEPSGTYPSKSEYFYPDNGVSVVAGSQQEADEELAKITSRATLNA